VPARTASRLRNYPLNRDRPSGNVYRQPGEPARHAGLLAGGQSAPDLHQRLHRPREPDRGSDARLDTARHLRQERWRRRGQVQSHERGRPDLRHGAGLRSPRRRQRRQRLPGPGHGHERQRLNRADRLGHGHGRRRCVGRDPPISRAPNFQSSSCRPIWPRSPMARTGRTTRRSGPRSGSTTAT
jgi:hypothetical protein